MTESGIYHGIVYHERFMPTRHRFTYQIYLLWLNTAELETLSHDVKHFSSMHRALVEFRRSDYVGDESVSIQQAVLAKIESETGLKMEGDVFFLGQPRTFGLYFSPVNFYFVRPPGQSRFSHMLAEVSNTPWNERHYYVVDLRTQQDTEKQFHVSPFNPIEMTYQWRVGQPGKRFAMAMDCLQSKRDFTAALQLERVPLTSKTLRGALLRIPGMTVKTVVGIYWEALKLWLKRTPVYTHPDSK